MTDGIAIKLTIVWTSIFQCHQWMSWKSIFYVQSGSAVRGWLALCTMIHDTLNTGAFVPAQCMEHHINLQEICRGAGSQNFWALCHGLYCPCHNPTLQKCSIYSLLPRCNFKSRVKGHHESVSAVSYRLQMLTITNISKTIKGEIWTGRQCNCILTAGYHNITQIETYCKVTTSNWQEFKSFNTQIQLQRWSKRSIVYHQLQMPTVHKIFATAKNIWQNGQIILNISHHQTSFNYVDLP